MNQTVHNGLVGPISPSPSRYARKWALISLAIFKLAKRLHVLRIGGVGAAAKCQEASTTQETLELQLSSPIRSLSASEHYRPWIFPFFSALARYDPSG
jgi:hypothetical protein